MRDAYATFLECARRVCHALSKCYACRGSLRRVFLAYHGVASIVVWVFGARLSLLLFALLTLPRLGCIAFALIWPTPDPSFAEGKGMESFIQPTASGELLSGTFGAVRSGGTRFHEGIDLKPYLPLTRKGEATDPVYAAMGGTVEHLSSVAGRSSYGRYVVLSHIVDGVELYTLYAHLASVSGLIKPGQYVDAGTLLGVMGRSASGYSIPKDRAHLHFEVGLRFGDDFDSWYGRQKFSSPNYHGNSNGMNLCGFDPLAFFEAYRQGKIANMATYIRSMPTAYVLRVNIAQVPGIVRRSPGLLGAELPAEGVAAWDIAYTWYGLPKQFTPLRATDLGPSDKPGLIRLRAVDREQVGANRCRNTVRMKNGKPAIYSDTMSSLEMMFGMKISP